MMDQKKWELLHEAFKDDKKFDEEGYAYDGDYEGMNLMDWLDCDSVCPDWDTRQDFARHGYDVFPVEKDSFGWLIGGVRRMLDPSGKVITFG